MKIRIVEGDTPLLLAQPHAGLDIPPSIEARLNPLGRSRADTDWHVDRLYDGLVDGATLVATPIHRYVIDVNRDPSGRSLYPGLNTTGLCPTETFDGEPLYLAGEKPDAAEIEERRQGYHLPYHEALGEQIERLRARHGYLLLYDCHSIRSRIPYLFDGRLPDFNIGSNDGASCAPAVEAAARQSCAEADGYSHICNGRFKGGWTTRHYGDPSNGLHALQMELAQSTYMNEWPPWEYRDDAAAKLRAILAGLLQNLLRSLD